MQVAYLSVLCCIRACKIQLAYMHTNVNRICGLRWILQALMQHNTGRKEKSTPLSIDQRKAQGRDTLGFPVDLIK